MSTRFSALFLGFLCLTSSTGALSQPDLTWKFSTGMNRYTESKMKLVGPELGVHVRASHLFIDESLHLEGDVLLGMQRYSSLKTGSIDKVPNLETRWRVIGDVFPAMGFSAGLAVHTLNNDMRGTSSTGHKGYERTAVQYWIPVRWNPGNRWEYEFGTLISGKHKSWMSQASSNYNDITNTQKHGQYIQAGVYLGLANGDTLMPFFRYTHLAGSNLTTMGGENWIEPNNHRIQTGLIWQFASP